MLRATKFRDVALQKRKGRTRELTKRLSFFATSIVPIQAMEGSHDARLEAPDNGPSFED